MPSFLRTALRAPSAPRVTRAPACARRLHRAPSRPPPAVVGEAVEPAVSQVAEGQASHGGAAPLETLLPPVRQLAGSRPAHRLDVHVPAAVAAQALQSGGRSAEVGDVGRVVGRQADRADSCSSRAAGSAPSVRAGCRCLRFKALARLGVDDQAPPSAADSLASTIRTGRAATAPRVDAGPSWLRGTALCRSALGAGVAAGSADRSSPGRRHRRGDGRAASARSRRGLAAAPPRSRHRARPRRACPCRESHARRVDRERVDDALTVPSASTLVETVVRACLRSSGIGRLTRGRCDRDDDTHPAAMPSKVRHVLPQCWSIGHVQPLTSRLYRGDRRDAGWLFGKGDLPKEGKARHRHRFLQDRHAAARLPPRRSRHRRLGRG